jgi:hypothetical protein
MLPTGTSGSFISGTDGLTRKKEKRVFEVRVVGFGQLRSSRL